MTAIQFCCWLRGYFQLANVDARTAALGKGFAVNPGPLTQEQVAMIESKLSAVFARHLDPRVTTTGPTINPSADRNDAFRYLKAPDFVK
jgi:hypothetical protein